MQSRAFEDDQRAAPEKVRLFLATGNSHALERAVEPDVDIEVAGALVEVKASPGRSREVSTLTFPQLGKPV
jgi:hypothetical protein